MFAIVEVVALLILAHLTATLFIKATLGVSTVDKELLFKPRLPEADIEVPGIGTVRVRGLSRIEAIHVNEASGTEAIERRIIALGMVDPPLTEAEAGRWQKAATGGELDAVSTKIGELSGMLATSEKAAYKSDDGGPSAGVRTLPSSQAGDAGRALADGDER